jgi:hypothetical protein
VKWCEKYGRPLCSGTRQLLPANGTVQPTRPPRKWDEDPRTIARPNPSGCTRTPAAIRLRTSSATATEIQREREGKDESEDTRAPCYTGPLSFRVSEESGGWAARGGKTRRNDKKRAPLPGPFFTTGEKLRTKRARRCGCCAERRMLFLPGGSWGLVRRPG